MTTPQRIQLRRTKGWRKPEGAIVVSRPSKWGNPYRIEDLHRRLADFGEKPNAAELRLLAVDMFRADLTYGPESPYWWYGPHMQIISVKAGLQNGELRGRDLCCWCPIDQPCHADVLLELASGSDQ
jgi:hypothetical protein